MDFITTTKLRTQSSQLVRALAKGESIRLIHRSQVVGKIIPEKREAKPFDAKKFNELLSSLKPIKIIPKKDREKVYRERLMEKYGKDLL